MSSDNGDMGGGAIGGGGGIGTSGGTGTAPIDYENEPPSSKSSGSTSVTLPRSLARSSFPLVGTPQHTSIGA